MAPMLRMIERGEQLRLPVESHHPLGISCRVRVEHLDRDLAVQSGVARPIHLSHAPRTER